MYCKHQSFLILKKISVYAYQVILSFNSKIVFEICTGNILLACYLCYRSTTNQANVAQHIFKTTTQNLVILCLVDSAININLRSVLIYSFLQIYRCMDDSLNFFHFLSEYVGVI